MKNYNSSKLLAQAQIFLDGTLKSSVRCWALQSIISLAQVVPDPALAPTSIPPPVRFPSFRRYLGRIGVSPTDEEWATWLDANASVLGELPTKAWYEETHSSTTYLTCEAYVGGHWKQFYIASSNKEPPKIDVTSSSYLRPVGSIPQLWMFGGEYVGEPSQPISSRVAHYNWFIDSVAGITGGRFDSEFPVKAESFVIGNKNKLDAIRKWFSHEPKKLGGGSDGVAWDIGNRRILKIFSDSIAYAHALQATDRIHTNPSLGKNEAMIYDVGAIGSFENYHIYYYIMERMAPVTEISGLSDNLRPIVSSIVSKIYKDRSFWRNLKKKNFKTDGKLIQAEVKKAAARYAQELQDKESTKISDIESDYFDEQVKVDQGNAEEHVVPLSKNWLPALAEEILVKYLTGRTDLHLGNLGVTAYGEFRYFDPAFEGWTSNVNMGGGIVPKPEESEIDWGELN